MAQLGIHVVEKATSVSKPNQATVAIPFVVGTAPVQSAVKPARPNVPVLCTSWDEAVEKLGFSYDWESYTLCEFFYSHFRLFGAQPVIFCNVLDPETMKEDADAADYDVSDHKITLPVGAVAGSVKVKVKDGVDEASAERELAADEDYSVFYGQDDTDAYVCIVELLESGGAYDAEKLNVSYRSVAPKAVTVADMADGVAQVDACMTAVGVVPDLIAAPGWSHNPVIAAVMAAKAGAINGLFKGKAVIDADSGTDGVTEFSQLLDYKNKNSLVDADQILCWPMATSGDYRFHLSTQLCGLMAEVDAGNRGVPYESPSNKNLKIDGLCLEDGTEVNLTWDQVNLIAGSWGVVTALYFPNFDGAETGRNTDSGWVAKGNYTACYPGNTDVKDRFIPVSRMFDFIGNTLIRTFWSKLDKPMTPALRDSILQTCNIWLGGLCGSGYLYGARCELLAEENPLENLMDGKITLHCYVAPPVPLQTADFVIEYSLAYMETALSA